jgi:hypothetical protein
MGDAGDALVIIVLTVVIGLVAWPRARRWLRNGHAGPLVDPEQNITIDMIDGLPGFYETNYRPRRLARGRRNPAPPGAVIHHRTRRSAEEADRGDLTRH